MSGKGSGRRPLTVSQEQFASNWDRVFIDAKSDMLREVANDGMWRHSCTATMETFYIGKNEVCDYCGEWEEDGQ